ncbi:OmpA family protein [Roseovarius aestuarii]|nr:OmpA family protein [Roseovarius aestuarii]
MRLSSIFTIAGTFVLSAIVCWVAAGFAVTVIEDNSRGGVRAALDREGLTWTEVDSDGLQVFLGGTAPSEAKRFNALSVAGGVVDAARVIDQMLIEDSAVLAPPRFSIEILRNGSGISLIGLIPAETDREAFLKDVHAAASGDEVADLLDSADYPVADSWEPSLNYALRALKSLPRAKISVAAGQVSVTTMADSPEEKQELEEQLGRRVSSDVKVSLNISAPRPVITPFTLRFLIEDGTAQFDACSADTEEARLSILTAARAAGLQGDVDCVIGLGVPTPQWGRAGELAIAALAKLGGGSVTFADADISLLAAQGTEEALFDDVVGRLQSDLPEVFALHAILPPPDDDSAPVIPEFTVTLSPEGLVQLRGKVGSDRMRDTVDSFARARFASGSVYTQVRVAEGLPEVWPVRVLTGLETLSYLSNGAVTVTPTSLSVSGNTGRKDASAQIAGLLAEKLSEAEKFDIDVTYREKLDPIASIPTPEECIAMIAEIQSERKINFEPGGTAIDSSGAAIMDDIAEVLEKCGDLRIEIGGHTDSQGRETMNEQLSQQRANSVLEALRERRVLTSGFTAKGYGESQPIADNDTEEGREQNRRIEFKVISEVEGSEEQTTLEADTEAGQTDAETENSETDEGAGDEQN